VGGEALGWGFGVGGGKKPKTKNPKLKTLWHFNSTIH
jgi:hypothetical protein